MAKGIKTNQDLALALWKTENLDARLLATLIVRPQSLSVDELDAMVQFVDFAQVANWLTAYVIRKHPDKEALRQRWMASSDPWAARAGKARPSAWIVAGLHLARKIPVV